MLVALTFFVGDRGDTIARHGGKICLLARRYTGRIPKANETWLASIDADEGRFYRVRPLQPVSEIRYGWYPTERVALGIPELDWLPVEPLIRAMEYNAPRCASPPDFWQRSEVNAPYRAAKELADRLARGGPVYDILPVLGWPDAVEGTDSEWVTLIWQHPTYGELRYRGWLGADQRISGSRIPWRVRREYARAWPMEWTGEIRVRKEYGPPVVMAARRLRAWPDVIVWTQVGWHGGVSDSCPPEIAARAATILSVGAKPLAEYTAEYAATLAAWVPWRHIWRRALWLADEDGSHSRVVRLHTSWKGTTPTYESDDGAERGGGDCTYHSVVDLALTGYLRSGAASISGSWSYRPRGPDVPASAVFPDTRGYVYDWYPYQDTALTLRETMRMYDPPDISAWPNYPKHPQGSYADTELYGHPTGTARAQILAEVPELPCRPGVAQEVAYTADELAAYRTGLDALRDQRLAEIEAQVQALAGQIRDIFAADLEWVAARTALVAARKQAEELLRSVRNVTLAEEFMVPAPERATAFDAASLRAEAEEMSVRASGLRGHVERAIEAHRLPIRASAPVVAHQPEGASAPWTCDGLKAEEVTARIGVPEGVGVSGLILADGRAERGTYPLVAIARPFAGGKRWTRTVVETRGLHPLIDERQGRVSGSPYSSPLAVLFVGAVVDPSWSITIETTKDGETVDVETIRGSEPSLATPTAPATLDSLRARWSAR